MTIALIDDSDSDIQLLHDYLSRYCHEHHVYMTIEKFTNEHIFLNSMKQKAYDLVFLDIYMQQTSGIQIAVKLRETQPKCQIIFTTASREHAVNAFRLHALDYLVKPFTYEMLSDAVNRFEQIASKFAHYIEVKEGRHYTRVLISDIIYISYDYSYSSFNNTSIYFVSYPRYKRFILANSLTCNFQPHWSIYYSPSTPRIPSRMYRSCST